MDETFIVNDGILTAQVANKEYTAKAGSVIYVPRFTPHGFRNDTNNKVKLTLLFNPAQKREVFFRGLQQILRNDPVDSKDFLKLYNKYDSYPVDESQMIPIRK